jgi:hypothetical protein
LVGRNQPIFCPVPHSVTGFFLRAGFCMQVLEGNGSFFEKYKANERPLLADTAPSPSDAIDPDQALQTL